MLGEPFARHTVHDLRETSIYLHLSRRHLQATASPLDSLVLKGRSQQEE